MENGSTKRKNLKFTEIEKLSQDLQPDYNELIYGESGISRYAMNRVLRDYAGMDENFKIHAFFEHGVVFVDLVQEAFRVHEYLPSIVPSNYRLELLKKQPNYKGAYTIGPFIHYADSLLSKDQIKEEKERLGRNLLVFPSHSIDGSIIKFDYDSFIAQINDVAKDYDSVRVCMYYKDVQLNHHLPYKKAGFELVTAGHFNDYNFLLRLKSIIQTSDMTMGNNIGTHLGYCIYLNKPHYLFLDDIDFYRKKGHDHAIAYQIDKIVADKINKSESASKMKQLFSQYGEEITKEQYDIISYFWGFDCIKTPEELRKIFLELDENYSVVKYYFSQLDRLKSFIKMKYIDPRIKKIK